MAELCTRDFKYCLRSAHSAGNSVGPPVHCGIMRSMLLSQYKGWTSTHAPQSWVCHVAICTIMMQCCSILRVAMLG